MAVSRVLSPLVKRGVIATPLQVKAIAHAHVKTDKVDAGTLASLYAAGDLPEIWTPDAATERMRRLVARRYRAAQNADQERGARNPARPSDPTLPTWRSLQPARPRLADAPTLAG